MKPVDFVRRTAGSSSSQQPVERYRGSTSWGLMPDRMRPFACSTWTFDCGWATDAKSRWNALCCAETSQGSFGEVGAVVGDDAVWDAISRGDVGDESPGSRPIQLLDWPGIYPLGELVHIDKQMSHAAACCLEWSHHVQPPDGKGPGNGDSLECRSRLMRLGAELLAPFAFLDQVFGVF